MIYYPYPKIKLFNSSVFVYSSEEKIAVMNLFRYLSHETVMMMKNTEARNTKKEIKIKEVTMVDIVNI